jgi:hypothetical protein
MKKLIAFFFVALLALSLAACQEREYPVDGVFLGYEVGVSRNAPMVTYVAVTIEKGKVVGYNIDVRQGVRTNTGTTEAPNYTFAWNAQTKKELGDAYGMKPSSAIGKEWYEQAAAIEAFWLANGIDAMTKNADTNIDNITGVSIKDAYSVAGKLALENAKAGKFVALYCSGTDLYSATMTLTSKGKIDTLVLDVLQATKSATEGTFVWRTQTKQQLGFAYRMHNAAAGRPELEADYVAWLRANNKLEWFEQANLITADIIANGWSATASENVPAGVSITTTGYYAVLATLFGYAGNSVK